MPSQISLSEMSLFKGRWCSFGKLESIYLISPSQDAKRRFEYTSSPAKSNLYFRPVYCDQRTIEANYCLMPFNLISALLVT